LWSALIYNKTNLLIAKMKLSDNNAKILLLDKHQTIEEYADVAVNNLLDKKNFDFLAYPPNGGLSELEMMELRKLGGNQHLKSALKKVIADNAASVIFNLLNLLDGTSSPKNNLESWSGVQLVDEGVNQAAEPGGDFLHDKFYETFWDWK
jgi:hypothetical protein